MDQPLIVYPDAGPSAQADFDGALGTRLTRIGRFILHEGAPDSDAAFAARIADATAIILGWGIPDAVLADSPALRMIAFTGIGVSNHVNLSLASERGITVCNTPGYADTTVAEHTMALMLAVVRNIPRLDAATRSGTWDHALGGVDLNGKCLGLVGLGGIGTRVARLANAFGMEVIAWTPNPSPQRAADAGVAFTDLDSLFRRADVVSLHSALTPDSTGMITDRHLSALRDGAALINTARGELVDEKALLAHLAAGRIAAGLDVFHQEPLAEDHAYRALPNVVLTPHSAYNTPDARLAIHTLCVDAIEGFYTGYPVNVVTA